MNEVEGQLTPLIPNPSPFLRQAQGNAQDKPKGMEKGVGKSGALNLKNKRHVGSLFHILFEY
jgi:hypothetical protein